MTQPAVSQAIASLERDFGAKLLDRSSVGTALTDAGRLCAARIERMLENLLQALKLGRADVLVGALRQEIPNDVLQEHLFDDPLAIVVRAEHPLARVDRVPKPNELRDYAWIAPRLGSPLRRHYEALVKLIGVTSETAPIECNSLVAARAMLLASDRLMLLSAHQVRQELATGELTLLRHPLGRVTRAIGLTIRRSWVPTQAQCE